MMIAHFVERCCPQKRLNVPLCRLALHGTNEVRTTGVVGIKNLGNTWSVRPLRRASDGSSLLLLRLTD
jgi:hypothetical protein